MVDSEWIKNLADAVFAEGSWHLKNPDAVAEMTAARIADAMTILKDEATAMVALHNEYSHPRRAIRVLDLPAKLPMTQGGIIIMLCKTQICLELEVRTLIATVSVMREYMRGSRELHRYEARADQFGTVVWARENTLILTPELIIKTLLEELTRTAFQQDQNLYGDP